MDLQVNGYKGISFSDATVTKAELRTVILTYSEEAGCLAILPTVVTASMETYRILLPKLSELIQESRTAPIRAIPELIIPSRSLR